MATSFYCQSFGQESGERKPPKKYFLCICVLMSDLRFFGLTFKKPTLYLLQHGDFQLYCDTTINSTPWSTIEKRKLYRFQNKSCYCSNLYI